MPINKNAQLRYQILDRCFSDFSNQYTIDDLLEVVNEKLEDLNGCRIQKRQLWKDILEMQYNPYRAPIKKYATGHKQPYYRYSDRNYSIFNNQLSPEEINNLQSTIDMLGRYRGIPSNAWLEEVISNLEFRFGIKSNRDNIIAFDQNAQLTGLEHLSKLIDAAVNHKVLFMHYQPFSGNDYYSAIHPYHLKQYNNRWFLFGLEEQYLIDGRKVTCTRNIVTRALDRIVSFSVLDSAAFIENKYIDFHTYFDDVVGVTIPHNVEPVEVTLQFSDKQFPYVVSKPIHHTQKIIDAEKHIISFLVIPNKELKSIIQSYGADVTVIAPESLRKEIAEDVEKSYNIYNKVKV